MVLFFYLSVLLVILIDLKDLINIKSLIDKRLNYKNILESDLKDVKKLDKKTGIKFVINTISVYFYFIVLIVGVFSSQWVFFVIMILLTLISAKIANKLESDRNKFTTYFIFDKAFSILILCAVLYNAIVVHNLL